jgi:D-arabinose 1-dehydrogenase-like Zn-dependent alcohol dehydrogenase
MDPLPIPALGLIAGDKVIEGHASGTAMDSEDTLRFSQRFDVSAMIETVPLEQANDALNKMLSGEARFRMVLTTGA